MDILPCTHCQERPRATSRSTYCSDQCKGRAAWAKRKAKLTTEDHRRRYEAAKLSGVYERQKAAKRQGRPARVLLPSECTLAGCVRKPIAKGLCSTHYRLQARRDGVAWAVATSDQRSRAKYWGAAFEWIRPVDVFERDGWTCRLCVGPVDRTLSFPDPGSASVDHVIPLSQGGDHLMSNVQCSHLGCNMSKHGGERIRQEDVDRVYALVVAGAMTKQEAAAELGCTVRTFNGRTQHHRGGVPVTLAAKSAA